eukprot:10796410-Alexandrium_andersonii.AAC.1
MAPGVLFHEPIPHRAPGRVEQQLGVEVLLRVLVRARGLEPDDPGLRHARAAPVDTRHEIEEREARPGHARARPGALHRGLGLPLRRPLR